MTRWGRGDADTSAGRSAWLAQQTAASRAYFVITILVGVGAFGTTLTDQHWTDTRWSTVLGWAALAILTSFSIALQLRKIVDGSGTVTMRDVWALSALVIWGLPAALLVNLAVVLWSETVTKVWIEGRNFILARCAFNAAFTTVALVVASAVVNAGDGHWGFWLLAGVAFEAVTVLAVEIHVIVNKTRRRLSRSLTVLAATCLTEVPLAAALVLAWSLHPVLAVCLAFPMFVTAAGLQYILEFLELRDLVSTDSRTGLLTPTAWRESAEKLVRSHQIAVLMADLDNFKNLNDSHGHLVGDEILKQVGDILISSIRPLDLACRWGGEEFVLLLVGTPVRDAVLVAERIRARVATEAGSAGAGVTISIGVAGCPPTSSQQVPAVLTATMGLADEALYLAKGEGRNRVAVIGADAR